ncbi:sugar O-acetyltransferase [Mesoterricola sediminis]|uniref:Nodulation protein L n=1 Tax=Mesoterricola sediminis TaxID=2927980 RepID=A0AA48KCP6_9BACT|nr:sugar O-acetyltransferase [Mesoterricola sediminis]BDU75547.1 maltose O-acetyltransferase [Mesoterricola sediminis]
MTEQERMLRGEPYDPLDPALVQARARARRLTRAYASLAYEQPDEAAACLRELIPHAGARLFVEPPFFCDYGAHLRLGDDVYFNFNCVVLDVCPVTLGSRVLIGPAVQIYTATHPLDPEARASGREFGRPVTIGDDVWVGGGTVICPGVTIGARTVIGAGSVVTRDLPAGVLAAGNPCRVIRTLAPGSGPLAGAEAPEPR